MGMPTKNCKIIMEALNAEKDSRIRFDANDIAQLCGVSFADARRAAQYLAGEGFLAEVTDFRSYSAGIPGFETYELTEKGRHPKAFQRYLCREFLKSQIIAILALIVAIISLLMQVVELLQSAQSSLR